MARKPRRRILTSKKDREKRNKLVAEKSFPREEFEEYWKKHSDEVGRAVYAALLDGIANNKLSMMGRTAYGKIQKIDRRQGKEYLISPYKTLMNDSNYYVLGVNEKNNMIIHYRLDRMLSFVSSLKHPEIPTDRCILFNNTAILSSLRTFKTFCL